MDSPVVIMVSLVSDMAVVIMVVMVSDSPVVIMVGLVSDMVVVIMVVMALVNMMVMISDMVVVDIVVIIVVIQNFRSIIIDALRNNLDEIDFIQAAVLSLHIGFESE